MTFFHFVNCVALTFAPFFLLYKYSGLAEYSSLWKIATASLAYFGTQLAKLMVLATFFPAGEEGGGERWDMAAELLKASVELVELAGLHLVISYSLAGKGEVRFLATGVGWAAADCLASRVLPFWLGARGLAFDWRFVQLALESNLNLIHYMSAAALVWLYLRIDLPWQMKQATTGLLAYVTFKSFIFDLLFHAAGLKSWTLLLVKAFLTITLSLSTAVVYSSLHRRVENSYR